MSWALFACDFNDELTHSKVISGLFSVTGDIVTLETAYGTYTY